MMSSMGCGAEGVSDHQKGVISFFIFGDTVEKVIDLNLAEVLSALMRALPEIPEDPCSKCS
jgi:hypothetical protein